MSDATIDRGLYFRSPMSDWYRAPSFKVALALSVVIHAILIAFIPGFRSVTMDMPRVLDVQIIPMEPPPVQEVPVVPKKIHEPKPEPVVQPPLPELKPELPVVRHAPQPEPKPEPVARQPQPESRPEPVVRQPQPEPPPVPRAEIIQRQRAEPQPDFVVPKPDLRPEPEVEPKIEARPEPKIEPRPEPPPVARVEPRPEPPPVARVEPRPEPPPVARVEPRPEPQPVREAPPPTTAQPLPPAPKIDEVTENRLLASYGQSISREIRRYQKYPPQAQRRRWEGTVEVLLQIAANGKVTGITLGKSSGHAILDDEALEMVRRASPLPQAPADLGGRALVVSVPIAFRLQNS